MNPTTIPATADLLAGYAGPAYDTVWCTDIVVTSPFGPTACVRGTDPRGGIAEWERRVTRISLPLLNPIALDWTLRHLAAQGHPAWRLRDTASGGTLTAQVAAEAVAWSVASVERGGGMLRGVAVLLPEDPWMRYRERGDICAHDGMGKPRGFGVMPVRPTQECYDAVLLERNYGTLNPDGTLTLPALLPEKP